MKSIGPQASVSFKLPPLTQRSYPYKDQVAAEPVGMSFVFPSRTPIAAYFLATKASVANLRGTMRKSFRSMGSAASQLEGQIQETVVALLNYPLGIQHRHGK